MESVCRRYELDLNSGWFIDEIQERSLSHYKQHFTQKAIDPEYEIEGLILNPAAIIEFRKNNQVISKLRAPDLINQDQLFPVHQVTTDEADISEVKENFNFISYLEATGTFQKRWFETPVLEPSKFNFEVLKIKLPYLTITSLVNINYAGIPMHIKKGDIMINRQILSFI